MQGVRVANWIVHSNGNGEPGKRGGHNRLPCMDGGGRFPDDDEQQNARGEYSSTKTRPVMSDEGYEPWIDPVERGARVTDEGQIAWNKDFVHANPCNDRACANEAKGGGNPDQPSNPLPASP